MNTNSVLWAVGLSNGENYQENKGKFEKIAGELSPWKRLQKYVAENNLMITSLSLVAPDGRTFTLPSSGNNPKFKEFDNARKPDTYAVYRKMGLDVVKSKASSEVKTKGGPDFYTFAEVTYYPDFKVQLWVDERTFNSWIRVCGIDE